MSRKAVTLAEVAKHAGVSKSTAARVLAVDGKHQVAADLAAKVREAARELGYTPNLMARSLRVGSRPLVGLMVADMLDPYFAAIGESVTVAADELGLAAMVANMQRDPVREIELCRRFLEHRVSGVILSGGGYDQDSHHDAMLESVEVLERSGCQVVLLSDRDFKVPTFSVDDRALGALLVSHLVERGHQDLAIVYAEPVSHATRLRHQSSVSAARAAGCRITERTADYSRGAGYQVARQLFGGARVSWPTAVIAGSDSLAFGMLEFFDSAGLSVPDDVSIIGVGNTYYAEVARPHLTTIEVNSAERGLAAVNYLAKRFDGTMKRRAGLRLVKPVIVERETVGKPSGR
jgi:LacI family transcriptional regulator